MVYNFNLGIGWASSGVEYAQSYRANLLRRAHIPARFVFTDMFPTENIEHMTRKADKALYYVKQNCKGSYFFYEQLLADNKENTNLSADLRNVAKLLKESGSYTGALNLNYREFARIYEFVNNVGDRHKHNCYLVMVTMNTLPEQLADIEEIEKALDCMEQSIRSKIRKVDVCTRYSSMQYLIILFEPQENQIPNVMERIFMHYYKLCDREDFKPQYEYIKMAEAK